MWSLPWLCSRTTPSARVDCTSSPGAGSDSTRSGPSAGAGSSGAVHSGCPSGASSATNAFDAQYGDDGPEYDWSVASWGPCQPRLSSPSPPAAPCSRKYRSEPLSSRRETPGDSGVCPETAPIATAAPAAKR